MDNQTIVTLISAAICLLAAWRLLTRPTRPVQWARWFTLLAATGSIVCTLAAWLETHADLARVVLSRGVVLAGVVGAAIGVVWLLRGRLRPKGFQPTSRRYARYASYKRVKP